MRMVIPSCLIVLFLALTGCRTATTVESDFYRSEAPQRIADGQFHLRVQADSEVERQAIETFVRERLPGVIVLADGQTETDAFVDVTLIEGGGSGIDWKPSVGGSIGFSNYGTQYGLSLGFAARPSQYPSMVMSLNEGRYQRLWLGICWLNSNQEGLESRLGAAHRCLELLIDQLRRDLAQAARADAEGS